MDIFSWFDSALFTVLFDSFWLQKELLDATLLLGLLLLDWVVLRLSSFIGWHFGMDWQVLKQIQNF
ncbi:hypothetical protein RhiirC2_783127 [Rhizophagus irregularis]|uniref:Uncharacterized protein n=1 Tax=Rhizophagus irregularis TaxID=588596 RepID=A0A2N1N1J9_9GLOM|nr:hypothetical protein RhiirC2_783127 [Rhizophagus irregularis]